MKSLQNISRNLITAGGLVINNNSKVLLIYRKNKWDLPKGKLDEGENLEEAAIREVVEETGLDITKLSINEPLLSTGYKSFVNGKSVKIGNIDDGIDVVSILEIASKSLKNWYQLNYERK